MTSFVYVLAHHSEPALKIGKANCIKERTKQIGRRNFDFAKSFAIVVPSSSFAVHLERILHELLAASRVNPGCALYDLLPPDGRTEWFYAACEQRIREIVGGCAAAFNATVISLLSEQKPVSESRPLLDNSVKKEKQPVVYVNAIDELLRLERETLTVWTRLVEVECQLGSSGYIARKYVENTWHRKVMCDYIGRGEAFLKMGATQERLKTLETTRIRGGDSWSARKHGFAVQTRFGGWSIEVIHTPAIYRAVKKHLDAT